MPPVIARSPDVNRDDEAISALALREMVAPLKKGEREGFSLFFSFRRKSESRGEGGIGGYLLKGLQKGKP